MKFGKQFESQQVPEWRDAYLDYKQLKLMVKSIQKVKKQDLEDSVDSQSKLSRKVSNFRRLMSGFHIPSPRRQQSLKEEEMILIEPRQNGDEIEFETAFLGIGGAHNELERAFFRQLDSELVKIVKFYKSKEKELVTQAAALDTQMESLILAKQNVEDLGFESSHGGSGAGARAESANGSAARSNLESVAEEDGSVRQVRIDIPAAKPVDALASIFSELTSRSMLNLNVRKVKRAEEMLQQAFVEFYKGLYILKNFSSLNIIAFSKVLKKYDKHSGRNAGRKYLEAVENSHLGRSEQVQKLMVKVEVLFTKHFTDSNHREAMQILRPEARKEQHRVTFVLGVFSGLTIALLLGLVLTIRIVRFYSTRDYSTTYLNSVFPIFSMLLAVMLHLFLYGVNIYMWKKTRINHTFILGLKRQSELSFRDVLLLGTGLCTAALGGMILHLQLTAQDRGRCCNAGEEIIPLVVVASLILLLFLPFNILYRSSRFFFLSALWHCLLTPFYKVIITDFLVGDQLTSQVQAIRDFEYVLCYYGGGFFKSRDSKACLDNKTFITFGFIMALLPYWCRFMQCLRRWYDEDHDKMQLYNALKYLSAILAVALRLGYSYSNKNLGLLVITIVVSAVATIVSTYWDIVYDWGLLNRNSENPWLRDKLAISFKSVYYFAIVSNVLLRFVWLQSLLNISIPGLDFKIMTLLVAALEVLRRGQWNYYRLENEHFNNVGKYRAVKNVPLPFVD